MFCTIWVHLGPFGCLTKLGAKRAELVQKFVPRSRVGIYRNEHTQSIPVDPKLIFWCVLNYLGSLTTVWLRYETRCKTGRTSANVRATKSRQNFSQRTHSIHPLDPKLMFLFVSYRLGALGTVRLPYETRCKTGRTSAKVRATKSRRNFSQRTHPILPIGPTNQCFGAFHTIWVHSEPFGCLRKLGAKRAELVQKFVPRSRVGIFHNECTRFTPLDPKLTFWHVSYRLGAFETVWLPYETRCKMGRTSTKGRAMKSRQNFSQRTHPIHPIGP